MIKYTNGFTVCFNDPKVGRKCLETLDGLLPVLKREKDFTCMRPTMMRA